jgi:hypothetical protein
MRIITLPHYIRYRITDILHHYDYYIIQLSWFLGSTGQCMIHWLHVYIPCDGATNRCGLHADGSTPLCIHDARGCGVDCNTSAGYYCGYNGTKLMDAICVYSEKYACFDNICTGELAFNETTIGCNQDSHHCTLNSTRYPHCTDSANGTSGAGVFCKGTSPASKTRTLAWRAARQATACCPSTS